MNNRKLGRFNISHDAIKQTSQRTLSNVMKHFMPIRAESMFDKGCIEYLAISELFDEVELGAEVPIYDLIIKNGQLDSVKRLDT